jgi:geranylgeranyl diphosphate synthase type I
MSFSTLQHQLRPFIEEKMKSYINSLDFGKNQNLKEIIFYHLGWCDNETDSGSQGKRLRPLLLLLCSGALREDIHQVMPAAVSIELLHNFTLIHDDIEDRSSLRHGRSTIWKKWGVAKAINAGDALFSIAQMSMLELQKICDEKIAANASYQLNHTCLQLTCGQHMDLEFEKDNRVGVDSYLEMIRGKTAALIALTTALGGLITGQSKALQGHLFEFGESLGMAFQIQDDMLGIWGDPETTGKSAASDIRSHKKSLPIIFGLEHSPEFKKMWTSKELTAKEINKMSHLLEACGAKAYVQSEAKSYTAKALNALGRIFPEKNEKVDALFELTEILLNRKF